MDYLKKKLAEIYSSRKLAPPKLTFLIVQKRNHLRSVDYDSYDKNPPPGTYIDNLAVIDQGQDNFYLYSHLVCFLTVQSLFQK